MKFGGTIGRVDRFIFEARKDMRKAMLVVGERKLAITQERVPRRTGKLAKTGRVSVRVGEKQVMVRLKYGDDEEVKYAIWVHENLTNKHEVGQAKYVESVIRETRDFAGEIAAELDIVKAAQRAA